MILLPYYITEKTLPIGCKVWTLWIFMSSAGKTFWKTEDEDRETVIREYLNENGIFGEELPSSDPFLMYKVDTEKTQIQDFHTWADILSTRANPDHAWRPFFWLGESSYSQVDRWGWKEEVNMAKIDMYTMGQIWELIASSEPKEAV
jgi:hypothetical protein